MASLSAQAELDRMIARFPPQIARLGRGAISRLRKRLPAANLLVYDNYNGCGVGFSPTERGSGCVLSIVLYPRRVSLFFLQAMRAGLDDTHRLLQGSGNLVRFIPLDSAAMVDSAPVRELMEQALAAAKVPMPRTGKGRVIIKSVSKRQLPRRPADGPAKRRG
jgi:hypothetical protein